MATEKMYLVIRSDRKVRVVKHPRLSSDEVALPLVLNFPSHWGRTLTGKTITITVPDFVPEVMQEGEPSDQRGEGS